MSAFARNWLLQLESLRLKLAWRRSTSCSHVGRLRNSCSAETDSDQRYPNNFRNKELHLYRKVGLLIRPSIQELSLKKIWKRIMVRDGI